MSDHTKSIDPMVQDVTGRCSSAGSSSLTLRQLRVPTLATAVRSGLTGATWHRAAKRTLSAMERRQTARPGVRTPAGRAVSIIERPVLPVVTTE